MDYSEMELLMRETCWDSAVVEMNAEEMESLWVSHGMNLVEQPLVNEESSVGIEPYRLSLIWKVTEPQQRDRENLPLQETQNLVQKIQNHAVSLDKK